MTDYKLFESAIKQRNIAKAYLNAKTKLIEMGYEEEIDWQYDVNIDSLTEKTFLQESAWVILNSGMRETTIRKRFHSISKAFNHWESAEYIKKNKKKCRENALFYFNHKAKIEAILSIANYICNQGFLKLKKEILEHGAPFLEKFPFIGPITSIHLAKNIGMNVAKPDRHMQRLASNTGYDSVQKMCEEISMITDDPVPVIDIVLWRFSTISRSTLFTSPNY